MAIENSGTATPGASNTIQRLPSPPFIHVPGLTNLRDAGGCTLENIPGKAVRRGILFRSAADPCKLDATGVAMLLRLGITHVFDLRSVIELGRSGIQGHGVSGDQGQVHDDQAMCGTGIKRLFVPVFLDKDYSPEALAERFGHYSDGPEVSIPIDVHGCYVLAEGAWRVRWEDLDEPKVREHRSAHAGSRQSIRLARFLHQAARGGFAESIIQLKPCISPILQHRIVPGNAWAKEPGTLSGSSLSA